MKIQKLTLKNWKCFREEKTFDFNRDINLIYGENESGKSSAIEGLRRAFFDKHTTSGKKMRSIEPWGGEGLAPTVKVVFNRKEDEYRIKKKFLYSEGASLEKKVDGNWERIAEGDAADKKIIDMVGGNLPGRGASKPKNWGMAQALWTQQGKIIPDDEFNTNFKNRIRKMIGEFVPSKKGSKINEKIKSEFESNLTSKTRSLRAGGDLKELNSKVEEQENRVKELKTKLEETEEIRTDLEDKKIEKKSYMDKKEEEKKRLEMAKESVENAKAHRNLREEKEKILSDKNEELNKVNNKINNIENRQEEIKEKIEEKEQLSEEIKTLDKKIDSRLNKINELKENKDELNNILNGKEKSLDDYRLVEQIIQKEKEKQSVSKKLEKARNLKKKINNLEQKIRDKDAPSKGEFEELKRLNDDLKEKEIQIKTIGLQANMVAKSEIKGNIYLDDENEHFELSEGEEKEWTTPQNFTLKLNDLVDVKIKSGSEDVMDLKESIEGLRNDFEAKTEVYGTKDIEKLREMMEELKKLKRRVNDNKSVLNDIEIPGLPSMDDTKGVCPFCDNDHRDGRPYKRKSSYKKHIGECASEKDKIGLLEILKKRIEKQIKIKWNKINDEEIVENYKNVENLQKISKKIEDKVENLKEKRKKIKKNLEKLLNKIEDVRDEKKAIEENISKIRENRSALSGEIERARKELNNLKDDDMNMKQRKKKRDELEIEVKKLEDRVNKLQEEKEKKEDRPFEELEQAKNALESIKDEIQRVDKDISELKGKLDQIVKEGIHSKLTEAQEKLSSLKREKERKEEKVSAIELLYDLINYHKEESMRTVLKPLEASINEDLERIIGREKYNVSLDEEIKPSKITPKTWDTKAETDLLSYGTKEQIAFSFRLSMGKILAEEENQVVILDDPLANTDQPRLHRSIGVLEDYSDDLQIILITCDRTKYSGLENPNVIEL